MRALFSLLTGPIVALAVAASASDKPQKPLKPEPAIGDFSSSNYAVTFKPPEHAFYCPLPDDWVGSDHGTVLFLEAPKACYGAGYPSSSRGFEPGDVPRIEVFYAYDLDAMENEHPAPPPCRAVGSATLFGKAVSLCRKDDKGLAIISADGKYISESASQFSAALVVPKEVLDRYMPVFKTMLATAHPCRETWTSYDKQGRKKKSGTFGNGPPCPPGQWY